MAGNRTKKEQNSNKTYYVRDAQGQILASYTQTGVGSIYWESSPIYGSSRLGDIQPNKLVTGSNFTKDSSKTYRGLRYYELSSHLGNVHVVITDRKQTHNGGSGNVTSYFTAQKIRSADYYPFGMVISGRFDMSQWSKYKYGFNGKENDNEAKGNGNQQDYGFRIYDPRVGRFMSVDPLTKKYPELTPYQFASNTPIWAVDLDGLEAKIVIKETYVDSYKDILDQHGEHQRLPTYKTAIIESIPGDGRYANYADNNKYGTEGTLTLEYFEGNGLVGTNYNSGKIDKFLDQGIRLSEKVESAGDAIAFGGFAAALPTEGASASVAAAGGIISLVGSGIKNVLKLTKKGNTKDDLIDLAVDVTFELLPNTIEDAINNTKLDDVTKKILKAQVNKTTIVGEKAAEKAIEEKRDKKDDNN